MYMYVQDQSSFSIFVQMAGYLIAHARRDHGVLIHMDTRIRHTHRHNTTFVMAGHIGDGVWHTCVRECVCVCGGGLSWPAALVNVCVCVCVMERVGWWVVGGFADRGWGYLYLRIINAYIYT